mgnify:CR=1 FL=1
MNSLSSGNITPSSFSGSMTDSGDFSVTVTINDKEYTLSPLEIKIGDTKLSSVHEACFQEIAEQVYTLYQETIKLAVENKSEGGDIQLDHEYSGTLNDTKQADTADLVKDIARKTLVEDSSNFVSNISETETTAVNNIARRILGQPSSPSRKDSTNGEGAEGAGDSPPATPISSRNIAPVDLTEPHTNSKNSSPKSTAERTIPVANELLATTPKSVEETQKKADPEDVQATVTQFPANPSQQLTRSRSFTDLTPPTQNKTLNHSASAPTLKSLASTYHSRERESNAPKTDTKVQMGNTAHSHSDGSILKITPKSVEAGQNAQQTEPNPATRVSGPEHQEKPSPANKNTNSNTSHATQDPQSIITEIPKNNGADPSFFSIKPAPRQAGSEKKSQLPSSQQEVDTPKTPSQNAALHQKESPRSSPHNKIEGRKRNVPSHKVSKKTPMKPPMTLEKRTEENLKKAREYNKKRKKAKSAKEYSRYDHLKQSPEARTENRKVKSNLPNPSSSTSPTVKKQKKQS